MDGVQYVSMYAVLQAVQQTEISNDALLQPRTKVKIASCETMLTILSKFKGIFSL